MSLFVEGKFFKEAGTGGGNGGGKHNLGWYADLTALQTAHPTGEDGDFAILGSTDTVWVWDSGTSAWVDTDQKGQVTSVNGQTGDVVLDLLPTQTGNAGKFLTTDGTDASWGNALANTADMWNSIATGNGTISSGMTNSISIGAGSNVSADESIAIGGGARVSAANAIMLKAGAHGSWATNSEAHTFKVNLGQSNIKLIDSDDKIPADTLTHAINKYSTMPTAASTNEGWIVQYTGVTDASYTHGYIYECKAQGTNPETYAWEEVSFGGNSIEITSSYFPAASQELLGKIYAYNGSFESSDDIVYGGAYENGCLYECKEGSVPSSMTVQVSGTGIESGTNVFDKEKFISATGITDGQTVTFTYVDTGTVSWDPLSGEVDGLQWSIADASVFTAALHTAFPNVDYTMLDNVEINYNGLEYGIVLWTEGWSQQLASASNIDPADYGVTVDATGFVGDYITFNTYMRSITYWDYNGSHLTQDQLWGDYGVTVWGTPVNNDAFSVTYTAAHSGYVWVKLDDKYYKLPELSSLNTWGVSHIVQLVGWQEGYEKGRFYEASEEHHDSSTSVSQTSGSDLTGISVNHNTFSAKVGWPDHDVDVVFKFVETTQTTGNITYHLNNIQATIDLDVFYSMLSGVTDVDMANMYKPEYASDGWQIAVKDPYDNWSVVAQNIDPAQWGITITSGTPQAWQESIEVYFTAFGGDQWGAYIDNVLQETGLISNWGISYSGTPAVGDEITGEYKTWYSTYEWVKTTVSDYQPTTKTITLNSGDWDNDEQTVYTSVDVNDKTVIVSPTPTSIDDYVAAGIKCVAQEGDGLTFACTTTPQTDIDVNIVIM